MLFKIYVLVLLNYANPLFPSFIDHYFFPTSPISWQLFAKDNWYKKCFKTMNLMFFSSCHHAAKIEEKNESKKVKTILRKYLSNIWLLAFMLLLNISKLISMGVTQIKFSWKQPLSRLTEQMFFLKTWYTFGCLLFFFQILTFALKCQQNQRLN